MARRSPKRYSDEDIVLALSVIQNSGSLRDACTAVQTQTGRRPDVHTVWTWAQRSGEAFAKLQPEKKREWEALAGRVFEVWANRALEAADAKDDDGKYIVSHAQVMVPFGIAKDGLTRVLEALYKHPTSPTQAFQFNVTVGGKPLNEVPDEELG